MTDVPTVLVVEHEAGCGLDRFEGWLAAAGVRPDVVRPYAGDALPVDAAEVASGLIVLGGTMNAYDDEAHPWLEPTRDLLARAVRSQLPTLGICLGAQLLAVACGGRVEVGAAGIEPGVVDVRWRVAADGDPLVATLPDPYPGPSMHHDAIVELPPGAAWLGETDMYAHQAFRLGPAAWGVQFHPEVSEPAFRAWAADCAADLARADTDPVAVVAQLVARDAEVAAAGAAMAARFAAVVRAAVAAAAPVRA